MQQVPDYYGLEVVAGLLQATGHAVAVKRVEKVEENDCYVVFQVSYMITLGAIALGAMGPVTAAGQIVDVVGATVVGAVATKKGMGKYVVAATDELGEDFHKLILSQEPF
ncbi:hypothetical protein Tco_0872040 [Tanacetum coccineum]